MAREAPRTIDAGELANRIAAEDVFVVDVRQRPGSSQIYGAVRFDPGELEKAERLSLPLPQGDGLIVLYDEDGKSERLVELARKFDAAGYGSIATLEGGFKAWEDAGGRTEQLTIEQLVPGVSAQHFFAR